MLASLLLLLFFNGFVLFLFLDDGVELQRGAARSSTRSSTGSSDDDIIDSYLYSPTEETTEHMENRGLYAGQTSSSSSLPTSPDMRGSGSAMLMVACASATLMFLVACVGLMLPILARKNYSRRWQTMMNSGGSSSNNSGLRVQTARVCLEICSLLCKEAHKLTTPFLLIMGSKDVVVDPKRAEWMMDETTLVDSKNKTLMVIEDALHGLLCEHLETRERIMKTVSNWIDEKSTT